MDARTTGVPLKEMGFIEALLERRYLRKRVLRTLRSISWSQFTQAKALQDHAVDLDLSLNSFEALQKVCGKIPGFNELQMDMEDCPGSQTRIALNSRADLNEEFFRGQLIVPLAGYQLSEKKALWERINAAAPKAFDKKRRMALDPSWWLEERWKADGGCIAKDEWETLQQEPRIALALAAVADGLLKHARPADGSLEWLRQARDWALLPMSAEHPMSEKDREFVTGSLDSAFERLVPGYAEARSRYADKDSVWAWELRHELLPARAKNFSMNSGYFGLGQRQHKLVNPGEIRQNVALIEEQDPGLMREFIAAKLVATWEEIKATEAPERVAAHFVQRVAGTPEQLEDLAAAFDAVGGNTHTLRAMVEIFSAQGYRNSQPMQDRFSVVVDKEFDSRFGSSNGVHFLRELVYPTPHR